ncbi:MAG: hypothetical protein NPIRA02_33340 [Nitrospirales bacterium]|nr:MAG: hypothetical protein NPIRA02_33340 [Nitrospirales bacterium]
MKNLSARIAQTLKIALVLGAAFSSTSCGPLFTLYASHEGWDCEGPQKRKAPKECEDRKSVTPLKDDEMAIALAEKFGLMALFAQVSYRHDQPEGKRDSVCQTKANPNYGMPKNSAEGGEWIRLNDATLPRWSKVKKPNARGCVNDESGLFYETYIYKNTDEVIEEAVISFRGTENFSDQILKDWTTSASATFGIQPSQYEQASNYLPALIESLKKVNLENNPIPRIYAVGHSLGGGLAQQAGYQFRDILKVFTFNSSPVTNWTWLRFRGLVEQEYPIIYRIYHGGEFLEKLRFFTTSFTSTSFRRYDVGIQFQPRSNIGGHAMSIFTCYFAALITSSSKDKPNATHFYGRKSAKDTVLGNPNICKPGYQELIKETNPDLIKVKGD